MINDLILYYLRNFKIDYGKHIFEKQVKLPENRKGIEFENPDGIKYVLDLTDHVMRQIYLKGVYERNTMRHLIKLARPDMTFMDVGANIGAYTLTMAKHLKQGKVISFEPNPRTINYLQRNIDLNGFKNIRIVDVGLSDKEEEVTLYTSSLTTASINKGKNTSEVEQIKLTTLDKFCSENNISSIDLIKIDIEGHEAKCLKGAEQMIAKSKEMVLIMEIDDNCKAVGLEKNELFHSITDKGFKGFKPRGYPFKMEEIKDLSEDYVDNIIFVKGRF